MSVFFFFKQKTAYESRISDWSSDVCSSDLVRTKRRDAETGAVGAFACDPAQGPLGDMRYQKCVPSSMIRIAVSGQGQVEGVQAVPHCRLQRWTSDRKRDVAGKGVSVRVDLGGRRILKKKKK